MIKENQARVSVSIFTTKWGHFSIGKAIEESLSGLPFLKTYLNNLKLGEISEKSYMFFYRLFPPLYKIPFKAAEQEEVSQIFLKYFYKKYYYLIKESLKTQRPKIVTNTYFGFNQILQDLAVEFGFEYINVIADPRSIHKLLVSKNGYNLVFDGKAKKTCLGHGAKKEKIISCGWFVRKDFNTDFDAQTLRKKLGIDKNSLNLTVVGGSAGTYSVLKMFPALISPKNPVHVIFICGESKSLFKSVSAFSETFSSKNLKITALGFKENIHEYLQASDLVIGKAGPNLLFETVATETPFFAITHISGQEDGNLEIIKKNKLGFVEENHVKLFKLLRETIKHPSKLKRFDKPLQKMSEYNKNSGKVLVNLIEEKLKVKPQSFNSG
jgi:UDP-N-acetylglucosamine:LPS N-acetylglucosamine transferase